MLKGKLEIRSPTLSCLMDAWPRPQQNLVLGLRRRGRRAGITYKGSLLQLEGDGDREGSINTAQLLRVPLNGCRELNKSEGESPKVYGLCKL